MAAHVLAENVSKQFQLRRDRADSVGHLLLQMIPRRTRPKPEPFWAVKDVSFEIKQGRSLGIVGNNGSGKSTLLKLLTRTMQPTEGHVEMSGRMSALIELGAGFHPDFTGRENIVLNASILGIRRREIEKSMEEIIDFAEIRPFIDVPVKYYSSGMHARLGFSVAVHVQPQLLIVDEVLAVGDEAFQQKCMDRIFEMKRSGASIILVSHDLGSIERLMDEAIWIDHGVIRARDIPREVVHVYRTFLGDVGRQSIEEPEHVQSSDEVAVIGVSVGGPDGKEHSIASGDPATIFVALANTTGQTVLRYIGISIRRPDGLEIADISGIRDRQILTIPRGQSKVAVSARELWLASGKYELDIALFDNNGRRLEQAHAAGSFRVQSEEKTAGVIVVPHEWRIP